MITVSFTVLYGTFICDEADLMDMSQVLISKQKRNEMLLFQDLYFIQNSVSVKSSVTEAVCSVCKKGLEDGLSITAITTDNKTRLYCENHFLKIN